jgi:hypothetical protein
VAVAVESKFPCVFDMKDMKDRRIPYVSLLNVRHLEAAPELTIENLPREVGKQFRDWLLPGRRKHSTKAAQLWSIILHNCVPGFDAAGQVNFQKAFAKYKAEEPLKKGEQGRVPHPEQ